MGTRLTTAIAFVLACGCARDEGVLVTLQVAPIVAPNVTKLEVFLGGPPQPDAGGRRFRDALAGTGDEEIFVVGGELDGATVFIRGPLDPDVTIAAIAGYRDAPDDEPVAFPSGLAIIDPLVYTPGEITTVDARLYGLRGNGAANRLAVRTRGPPVATQAGMLSHSCLDWEVEGTGQRDAIVRVDDFDCDGTLPIEGSCSDMDQDFFGVADDLLDTDADTDGASPCVRCPVNGVELPCDCDDNNSDVHVGATEICNGIDDDCDDRTYYIGDIEDAPPCIDDDGAGTCEVGLAGCDERFNDADDTSCKDATTTDMMPCELAVGACTALSLCDMTNPGPDGEQLIQCQLGSELGVPCLGNVPLSDLFDRLDPVPGSPALPATCDVAVWQPGPGLWHFSLGDVDNPTVPPVEVLRDHPCDKVLVVVDLAPAATTAATYAVITVLDSATGERFTLPLSFALENDEPCTSPPVQCLSPV